MYYHVIGADGGRYGPADIDTLVTWTREGRIIGSTRLIEAGTDREVRADSITAIDAELRRRSGAGPAVSIERSSSGNRGESPTMTRPYQEPHGRPAHGWQQPQQPHYGMQQGGPPPLPQAMPYAPHRFQSHRSKIVAGLLGIFLGWLGVHRFYLGYNGVGMIQLILGVCTCGITSIWGFVEGIVCLLGGMTDVDGLELRD